MKALIRLRGRRSRPDRLDRLARKPLLMRSRRFGVALLPQADRSAGRGVAGHCRPHPHRLGLNKLSALEPAEPVRRYERERPGEMIHLDIKKLGRIHGIAIESPRSQGTKHRRSRGEGIGWEFVHVAIDDDLRIAFAKVMTNERKRSATAS